jgi:drug/metabolite transporter (DMT)-like permease
MKHDRYKAYAALLANVLIWGAALPIVKPALEIISPFTFLYYRYALAACVMIPFLIIYKHKFRLLKLKDAFKIITIEFIQLGIGLSLLYMGLERTSALSASLIGSTSPILVIVGGIVFLKEREEKHEWVGLAISLIGTLIVIISPFLYGQENGATSHLGNTFVLLYALSWMGYSLLAKKYFRHLDKTVIAITSCFVGFISFALISPLISPLPSLTFLLQSGYPLLSILYMGTLGSSLAIGLFLYGQSKIEASEAALFTYLQPLIYIPLTVFWLKDTLLIPQLAGLLLIAGGVYVAEQRQKPQSLLEKS